MNSVIIKLNYNNDLVHLMNIPNSAMTLTKNKILLCHDFLVHLNGLIQSIQAWGMI
jgi:hypothetical protein